ncbi:MAG: leucine-rich repeat domain-containing protein [bacterium]
MLSLSAFSRFTLSMVFTSAFIVVLIIGCSKSTGGDDEMTDHTSPMVISDLAAASYTSQTVVLQWTAPKDLRDDGSDGMVAAYDLRISFDNITAQNFSAAFELDSTTEPAPAGLVQYCEIEQLVPDSTYYFAIKSMDDQNNWSGISNCCSIHCPAVRSIEIADSVLERIVREQINKPSGDLLSTDVDSIVAIDAPWVGIASLSGLENFISLQRIYFPGNDISDISPMLYITQLWELELTTNHITDISPLTGMTGLHQLHISDNPISDITPLASLTSLQQLWMFATQVTDFSPLYNLPYLTDVHFALLSLTDISFMSHLTHIQICHLNSNQISSITPLADLTALIGLDLQFNQISDLTPLSGLINLQSLMLGDNNITDIQPLLDNIGLGTGDIVYLNDNPLSQQAIDVQIPALQTRGVVVYH